MMNHSQVIYDRSWFQAKRRLKNKSLYHWFGLVLLLVAFTGLGITASPFLTPYLKHQPKMSFGKLLTEEVKPAPKKVVTGEDSVAPAVTQPEPTIKNFLLSIEKIGLINAPIIAQVDSGNPQIYDEALKQGLVSPLGSGFPGQGKLVYIYGHSTNYPWFVKDLNALLYQAEKLEIGDRIKIEFNGQHYVYYVFDKQIVDPDQIQPIKDSLDQDVLVLQTCYPPGTWLKRLLLFCQPSKFGALI